MARLIAAFEQFFDSAGNPLVGGQIDFFESGSSTVKKTTFADSGETIANPNPLIINGDGRCPNVFGTGNYRAVLRFAPVAPATVGVQILSRDPIGGNASLTFGADWSADQTYGSSDVVRDGGLYWVSQTNNNTGNTPSSDDGTSWLEFAGNKFQGNNPDLLDTNVAIILGSKFPDINQHIEIGPSDIQSKSDKTTVATLNINALGGNIVAGTSLDVNMIISTASFQVRNGATVVFETANGSSKVFNASSSIFEDILTTGDQFTTLTTSGLTSKEIQATDVGRETKMTATASVVINISFNGGWEVDEEAVFYYPSVTGTGTMTFTTSTNVILLDNRSVPPGFKCSIKYEGNDGSDDIYNFTGP